jgi:hypothetical protein
MYSQFRLSQRRKEDGDHQYDAQATNEDVSHRSLWKEKGEENRSRMHLLGPSKRTDRQLPALLVLIGESVDIGWNFLSEWLGKEPGDGLVWDSPCWQEAWKEGRLVWRNGGLGSGRGGEEGGLRLGVVWARGPLSDGKMSKRRRKRENVRMIEW